MSAMFGFFLRLFICFVAAKFLLHAVGVESRQYLMGLTVLLLVNVYWLGYLVFRDRGDLRPPLEEPRQNRPEQPAAKPPAGPSGES